MKPDHLNGARDDLEETRRISMRKILGSPKKLEEIRDQAARRVPKAVCRHCRKTAPMRICKQGMDRLPSGWCYEFVESGLRPCCDRCLMVPRG